MALTLMDDLNMTTPDLSEPTVEKLIKHVASVVSYNETLSKQIQAQNERIAMLEKTLQRTLELTMEKERKVELTTTSILNDVFKHISESLSVSLGNMKREVQMENSLFNIEPIDGVKETVNEQSLLVTKREGGYDYASVHNPDVVANEGMNIFDKHFDAKPDIFVDGKAAVNIYSINKSQE